MRTYEGVSVHADHNMHCCLLIERGPKSVNYVQYDASEGVLARTLAAKVFEERFYRPLSDYPVEKAVGLYREYARRIGITPAAYALLSKVVDLTSGDVIMADEASTTETETAATKSRARKASTAADAAPAKRSHHKKETAAAPKAEKPKAEKASASKAEKPKAEKPKTEKPKAKAAATGEFTSASQMFQALIMAGDMTDADIFTSVQTKFGLDDNKRSYVSWYRNHLKKLGKTVPDAKKED